MENWYVPISLVPGIGLLILSTANLMVSLSNELSELIKEGIEDDQIIERKMKQLKSLNQALVRFYVTVAFLAIAGLIGGLQIEAISNYIIYINVIGILIMISGLVLLIKYSHRAISIRQDQLNRKIDNRT